MSTGIPVEYHNTNADTYIHIMLVSLSKDYLAHHLYFHWFIHLFLCLKLSRSRVRMYEFSTQRIICKTA